MTCDHDHDSGETGLTDHLVAVAAAYIADAMRMCPHDRVHFLITPLVALQPDDAAAVFDGESHYPHTARSAQTALAMLRLLALALLTDTVSDLEDILSARPDCAD